MNIRHFPELVRTPSATDINKFNKWMQDMMRKIIGTNKDIIRELFE